MTTPQKPIKSPFGMKSTSYQVMRGIDLTGKTAVVTGGYSGVGLVVTKMMSAAGAHIIVPAHSRERANEAVGNLPNVKVIEFDLMDPQSIDQFAQKVKQRLTKLDLLIASAGIMFAPLRRDSRGNESQFSTNYLGHFQLIMKLYPLLKSASQSRVVILTSRAQSWNGVDFDDPNFGHRDYDSHVAYAQSKVADSLMAVELDRRAQKDGIRAFAVHPGLIPGTGLGRFVNPHPWLQRASGFAMNQLRMTHLISGFNELSAKIHGQEEFNYFKTVNQGAASVLWAATSSLLDGKGGVYVEDCNIGTAVANDSKSKFGARTWSIDPALAQRLWVLGEQLTGINAEEN